MFEVADDKSFGRFVFLELTSVYRNGTNSWRCETECGKYLNVREKFGIVHMALAETEHELIDENIVLNIKGINKKVEDFVSKILNKEEPNNQIITFNKIKEFMSWKVEDCNVWD